MREFNAKKKIYKKKKRRRKRKKKKEMTTLIVNLATKSFPREIEMKRIGPL